MRWDWFCGCGVFLCAGEFDGDERQQQGAGAGDAGGGCGSCLWRERKNIQRLAQERQPTTPF
ncbi:MAG: hypothetical protein ACK56I_34985, partial [bacterium]